MTLRSLRRAFALGLSACILAASQAEAAPASARGPGALVDPFHPALFAPLPPVPWFDADGDGVLTPEVDGIDSDESGSLSADEILHLLDGRAEGAGGVKKDIDGTADPGLNPGWDYLYLDTNGDGVRSVGSSVSGAESLPSMGQP